MTPLDTHPADLRVTFGGDPRPTVATAAGVVRGVALEAAVLSASHQIRTIAGEVLETLACAGPAGRAVRHGDPRLPARAVVPTAGGTWTLDFAFRIRPAGADELASLVTGLPAGALVHRFPGAADAVTAIALADDGWTTWHAYPEHELVAVSTTTATHVPTPVTAGAPR